MQLIKCMGAPPTLASYSKLVNEPILCSLSLTMHDCVTGKVFDYLMMYPAPNIGKQYLLVFVRSRIF